VVPERPKGDIVIAKFIDWTERGLTPDRLVRIGIRRLLKKRLQQVDQGSAEANQRQLEALVQEFSSGPLALVPEKANEQHYEVPAAIFLKTLGARLKYSGCYWPKGVSDLDRAEEFALEASCQRAELADGMKILELGCGWGSLSLWMAEKFPQASITSVSNSASQREFILNRANELGIGENLNVVTCDINDFSTDQQFDRVVSIEMFEHVRNHQELFRRISTWLTPSGKLFAHIFCHRQLTYKFQDDGASDWMSRYFFSGGIMPGNDLFAEYQNDLTLEDQWQWNGQHYQKTCEAWLQNMDRNRNEIMPVLEQTYGQADAVRWFNRWRMFYLACSELFGYRGGDEWWVSHYLFSNKP
jgi:cyclopropane-fatty-acyl-phospholipid synthase